MARYNPALGLQGNIKALFTRSNQTNATVQNNKAEADSARVEMEQASTDAFLNGIEAEQSITDLQLQIWELGGTF